MKIALKSTNKLVELPENIYIDQLMNIDLGFLQKLETINMDNPNLSEIQPIFKWIVSFFKEIGVKHRFTIPEFMELMNGKEFLPWMERVFGNLK